MGESSASGRERFVPRPIQTASAAEQIAEQIRDAIVHGQLPPGQRLPSEVELAAEYRVSRGTIRETLKLLAAQHLVESTRGAAGGTFVQLPRPGTVAAAMGETITLWFNAGSTSLAELNDARAWIERGCVIMAARNRTEDDLERIRETVEAMEAPGIDMDDMLAIDIDFHEAVCRAARNSVMELAMNAIHMVRPFTNTLLLPHLRIETIAAHHRAIYEPIRDRDERAAEAAFNRHIAHLDDLRERALADRRAEEVQVASLSDEAHPGFDRLRARLLSRR